MWLREIKQRGQFMALYAMLVPVLFGFVGAGIDLGWYYFNVSRLQNAADAAALAGARKIIDSDEKFKTYNNKAVRLVENILDDEPYKLETAGDEVAAAYVLKNISSNTDTAPVKNTYDYTLIDDWGIGGSSEIKMTPSLYQGGGGNFYYVVHLAENVKHLFLPGWFDDMRAPVVAVAILTKKETTTPVYEDLTLTFDANGGTFGEEETDSTKSTAKKSTANKSTKTISTKKLNPIETIKENNEITTMTPDDGTPTRENYEFLGWNTKEDGSGTYIYDGKQLLPSELEKLFGEEKSLTLYAMWEVRDPINNITLWQQMEYVRAKNAYDGDWNVSITKYGSALHNVNFPGTKDLEKTVTLGTSKTNDGNYIKNIDRLFIDFRPDYFVSRVHSMINVNTAYDVRNGKNDDPLYIRIESEPKQGNTGNAPQQIIINVNVSNLADNKRPLIFYYDGPLTSWNGNIYTDRDPVPVILNLNADFKGVLYMPDVPVVINGNGKGVGDGNGTNHNTFEGFIIAKEFRALNKTSAFYTTTHTVSSKRTTYKVDSKNNVQTILINGDYQELRDKLGYFYLSSSSKFRKFNIETDLDFTYIYYDANGDMVPLTDRDGNELIPLYDKNGNRITDWDKVKLYDKPADDTSRTQYPKKDTDHARVPLLDSDGKPVPVYDEYGNKIYFCEDYGRLGIQYTILTLHRVDDDTRKPHEFLLTQPESNSDDWL